MPRTVSASEAKARLGSVIEWAVQEKDEVIVESHGEPKAVIMAFEEYQKVKSLREQQRRQQVLERMRQLRTKVQQRKKDLTSEQAEVLADKFTREVVDDLVKEEKIRFEE